MPHTVAHNTLSYVDDRFAPINFELALLPLVLVLVTGESKHSDVHASWVGHLHVHYHYCLIIH